MEDAAVNLGKRNALRRQWLEKSRLAPVVLRKSKPKDKTPASATTKATEPQILSDAEIETKKVMGEPAPMPPVAEAAA